MIFSLATTLKESAETLISDRANAVEKKREDHMRKEEEKEMEKFRGTLVTRERFMAWVTEFKEEAARKAMAEKEQLEAEEKGKRGGGGGGGGVKEKRLTGGLSPPYMDFGTGELMGMRHREAALRERHSGQCRRFGRGRRRCGGRYCQVESQGVDSHRALIPGVNKKTKASRQVIFRVTSDISPHDPRNCRK